MSKPVKRMLIIVIIVCVFGIAATIFFNATPVGKALWNTWFFKVQKADDITSYETIKKVEDTCRAMIASYEADKISYETYSESTKETQLAWATEAKIRANRTAASYNDYILKNSFIWEDNIPSDIKQQLPYIS